MAVASLAEPPDWRSAKTVARYTDKERMKCNVS